MMTEELQRDYENEIISLDEWIFARQTIHEEWKRVEKEILENLAAKYGTGGKFE